MSTLGIDHANKRAAILIGVPIEFGDFTYRVGNSEWLAKYNPADLEPELQAAALRANWEEEYKGDVADPITELREFADSLDVDIRTQATLSDLNDCTQKNDVVIVFAHWKGAEVEAGDVLQPDHPERFIDSLKNDNSEIGSWLLPRLEQLTGTSGNSKGDLFKNLFGISKRAQKFATLQELLSAAVSLPERARRNPSCDQFYSGGRGNAAGTQKRGIEPIVRPIASSGQPT